MRNGMLRRFLLSGAAAILVLTGAGTAMAQDSAVTVSAGTSTSTGRTAVTTGNMNLRGTAGGSVIGSVASGTTVTWLDTSSNGLWNKIYIPSTGETGWIYTGYLRVTGTSSTQVGQEYYAKVSSGYLALRTQPAWDNSNIIGRLYTGDIVTIKDDSGSQYWYVYSTKYERNGYVNKDYLVRNTTPVEAGTYTVQVSSGYLALRSAAAYNSANETGKLYSGYTVTVKDTTSSAQYWWVHSQELDADGYVNKDYLVRVSDETDDDNEDDNGSDDSTVTMYAKVSDGYLALRSRPAYDSSNEIGRLYTGSQVEVIDTDNSQYWWVYSYKYDKEGYVNKDYLVYENPGTEDNTAAYDLTVSVDDGGYLALRNAMAFDSSNEIGKMWTGQKVRVENTNTGNSQYWYVYSYSLGTYGYCNKDYLT